VGGTSVGSTTVGWMSGAPHDPQNTHPACAGCWHAGQALACSASSAVAMCACPGAAVSLTFPPSHHNVSLVTMNGQLQHHPRSSPTGSQLGVGVEAEPRCLGR
jgi:hypothetical protein